MNWGKVLKQGTKTFEEKKETKDKEQSQEKTGKFLMGIYRLNCHHGI